VATRIEATNPGGLQQEGEIPMSNKPTHIAYVLTELKEGSEKKAIWHRVGSVWPHGKGAGFDIVIPAGISVSGRIVCTEPKDWTEQPEQPTA
jgi:hypothetical protein